MKNATGVFASTFGAFMGLAGLEHGVGDVLQGDVAPSGVMFPSWPDSAFFRIVGGEPAMTVIPNLLAAGILTCLISLILFVWVVWFIQRKNGGLILILLSLLLLLAGGGIFPPIIGMLIGAVATRIHAPLAWWRTHLSDGLRRFLGKLWPWSLGACFLTWLLLFPGLAIFGYLSGVNDPNLTLLLILFALGSLLWTILSGFAHDIGWPNVP
jgi:hypothetical protein